jgi:hypothetical protein
MKRLNWTAAIVFSLTAAAFGQGGLPREAESHITVLVDLSGTWLNSKSQEINKAELEAVATAVSEVAISVKPPLQVDYLEIGDGSLARRPICSARFSPSVFPSKNKTEFSDVRKFAEFFSDDCTRLILMRKPAAYTDISGALDTVARQMELQKSGFNGVFVLSDLKEERRRQQLGGIGSLRGVHTLLIYRVLEQDRYDPKGLDARIALWKAKISQAGSAVAAVDDISAEPAQMKRLILK